MKKPKHFEAIIYLNITIAIIILVAIFGLALIELTTSKI